MIWRRCTFDTNEQCSDWFRRLSQASAPPRQLPELFAFCFYAWACEREHEEVRHLLSEPQLNLEDAVTGVDTFDFGFRSEVERLGFDLHGAWRISLANVNYRLCGSYPPLLLIPACISDNTLEIVARFRSSRRVPVVVWRYSIKLYFYYNFYTTCNLFQTLWKWGDYRPLQPTWSRMVRMAFFRRWRSVKVYCGCLRIWQGPPVYRGYGGRSLCPTYSHWSKFFAGRRFGRTSRKDHWYS